jgi:hypothetical protein
LNPWHSCQRGNLVPTCKPRVNMEVSCRHRDLLPAWKPPADMEISCRDRDQPARRAQMRQPGATPSLLRTSVHSPPSGATSSLGQHALLACWGSTSGASQPPFLRKTAIVCRVRGSLNSASIRFAAATALHRGRRHHHPPEVLEMARTDPAGVCTFSSSKSQKKGAWGRSQRAPSRPHFPHVSLRSTPATPMPRIGDFQLLTLE